MQRLSIFLLLAVAIAGCSERIGGGQKTSGESCMPGEIRCTNLEEAEVCALDGTGFVPGSCAEGQVCVGTEARTDCADPDDCPDICKDVICTPGERFCNDSNNVEVLVCDDTGTGSSTCGSCAAPPVNGVCFKGECIGVCRSDQKSYLGCEYYAVDLDNAFVPCQVDSFGQLQFCDAAGAQFALVIANPDPEFSAFVNISIGETSGQAPTVTECTASQPDENLITGAIIPPRGLEIIPLPRRDADGTVKDRLAYRIGSNVPVTAYMFNPLENVDVFSNDASLLLPVNTAGDDYFVMTREQTFDSLKGFLTVVGVSEGTTNVQVRVTAKTLAGEDIPGQQAIPALQPGDLFETTLERFEVLNIESDFIGSDLTGSRITTDRPVLVYAGSEAANVPTTSMCDLRTNTCEFDGATPCGCSAADGPGCSPHEKCSQFITCCADHLEQQMFPVTAWGSSFVGVRSEPRNGELDVWRILAATDGTQVTLMPPVAAVPELDAGQWFEFESGDDFLIEASDPILVGQFLAAQDAPDPNQGGAGPNDAGTGDPAFMLAVPERQFRPNYVFLAPNKYAFDYVSIAFRSGTEARLDNRILTEIANANLSAIPGTNWTAARVPIGDGNHTLICDEPCSVMVHGYDQYVSYGYPGGLNLLDVEPAESGAPDGGATE